MLFGAAVMKHDAQKERNQDSFDEKQFESAIVSANARQRFFKKLNLFLQHTELHHDLVTH